MIKWWKKSFKWESMHNFDAIFNAESIDCFVFPIPYTAPEIILKKL